MIVNGYEIPDRYGFRLYQGWEREDFEAGETQILLLDGGDILCGYVLPLKHGEDYVYVFISHISWKNRILEEDVDWIAEIPNRAKRTKDARIKELQEEIRKLQGDE